MAAANVSAPTAGAMAQPTNGIAATEAMAPAAASAAADKHAGKAEAGARRPKYFREVGGGGLGGEGPTAAARGREQQQRRAGGREHLPPASSSLDTYTLLKFYSLSAPILQSVFRGLQDAEVGWVSWVSWVGRRPNWFGL